MRVIAVVLILVLGGCAPDRLPETHLFTDVTQQSGLDFENRLTVTDKLNPYTYRNFFNGAGVAVGDINNDGLQDIYFAGNQVDNQLYLNQGNFTFKNIAETAGVACRDVWSTGVTMVDINADGWLDIYVCKSGDPDAPHRYNELFINNGDLTFTERSREYGLDVTGLSVQAAFFDYDRDGDLDCYLLTSSFKSIGNFDLVTDQRKIPDPLNAGNKFYLNENGKFKDYSAEAGIYRSAIGFGLGITLGDFNDDGWPDIFVSNDFFERDYLYINNQRGAFTESLTDFFPSISMGSMGADFADLDNDGDAELFVTEMLPDSLSRKKSKTIFENWNKYQLNLEGGYHHQFSRNVLQKKIGKDRYAEIGRMAGVAATEWSWGALIFDMDNDGNRDIFVANGIYKDLLDRDYLTYSGAEENVRKMIRDEKDAILKLIDLMPSSRFSNYALKNEGNLRFTNKAEEWGLGSPCYSNGSAYGDFDNDGDLDLVVNNLNGPSQLFRNNTDSSVNKSITVSLTGTGLNPFAMGSEVEVYVGDRIYIADNFVTRGFQSSVQPKIVIGLGAGVAKVDSLLVHWPDNSITRVYDVKLNGELKLNRPATRVSSFLSVSGMAPIAWSRVEKKLFRHQSSGLVDFNRDRLLPMMYSNETPALIKGDIDGDNVDEVYVGGGKDQPSTVLRFGNGTVTSVIPKELAAYGQPEETRGSLFDVDGDGDLDLYMATGGRFFPGSSSVLLDKMFINSGKGEFKDSGLIPLNDFVATSVVEPLDFDKDGDMDLIVGERFDPFVYGMGGDAYLLQNNGSGGFQNVTDSFATELKKIGMVTDVVAQDVNKDGWTDVILVGDWMPVSVFLNHEGTLRNVSASWGLLKTEGWWHEIEAGDVNKDGLPDFALGNHGLNSFFKPGDRLYINDFDGNGSVEQIFCTREGDRYYPLVDKDEFVSQLPSMRKSLLYYSAYANRSMEDLFDKAVLERSKILQVNRMTSSLLLSSQQGYQLVDLPQEAQYSPIYAMLIRDFDGDGIADMLAGGNNDQVKPQFGRNDASDGWFFKGILSDEKFTFAPGKSLDVKGAIRDIEYVDANGHRFLIFAKYDDDLEVYKIK